MQIKFIYKLFVTIIFILTFVNQIKNRNMNLIFAIRKALLVLQGKNCMLENLIITCPFAYKSYLDISLNEEFGTGINDCYDHLFGAKINFDNYDLNIVLYDKTLSCINPEFKITITI